jgi:hypothetical protein
MAVYGSHNSLLRRMTKSLLTQWMPYEESLATEISWTELTSRWTKYRSPSQTVRVLLCVIRCSGSVITEPLLSSGRPVWFHYFGFQ